MLREPYRYLKTLLWIALAVGVFFASGPILFFLVVLGPAALVYLTAGFVLFGIPWGLYGLVGKRGATLVSRVIHASIAIACGFAVVYFADVPDGPDQCSTVKTGAQYELCLEDIFSGMTIEQTREWLAANGYTVDDSHSRYDGDEPRKGFEDGVHSFSYDALINVYRSYGRGGSIPYGTNFNRHFDSIIPVILPAPANFHLKVYVMEAEDKVSRVKRHTSFSFL